MPAWPRKGCIGRVFTTVTWFLTFGSQLLTPVVDKWGKLKLSFLWGWGGGKLVFPALEMLSADLILSIGKGLLRWDWGALILRKPLE